MCVKRIEPVEKVHYDKPKDRYYFDNNRVYKEENNEPVSELDNIPQNILYDFLGRYK